jgi:ribosome maturation factor RimP
LIDEKSVRDLLEGIILPPLAIFSLNVLAQKSHSLIEINLDNLDHPKGSVSIGDCAEVSRRLAELLDAQFVEDNYTLQVSSAGAERQVRIPEELERFKALPIKLHFTDTEGKSRTEIVVFQSLDGENAEFQMYQKKGTKKKAGQAFLVSLKDVKKGNLYLDF